MYDKQLVVDIFKNVLVLRNNGKINFSLIRSNIHLFTFTHSLSACLQRL